MEISGHHLTEGTNRKFASRETEQKYKNHVTIEPQTVENCESVVFGFERHYGIWRRVVRNKFTNFSEEYTDAIFTAEE